MNAAVNIPATGAEKNLVDDSLLFTSDALTICIVLFAVMISCVFFGYRTGRWRRNSKINEDYKFPDMTLSSMFGLMAFLLAFSFGMSTSRFDTRRKIIVDEANAISTVLHRADLYNGPDRAGLRNDLKEYLEARIRYYEAGTDITLILNANIRAAAAQQKVWARAAALTRRDEYRTASISMIPAITQMTDLRITRLISELDRVPGSIIVMLFVLAWASAFYLGYNAGRKGYLDWLPSLGFCFLTSMVIYITLDLDRPRRGLIQLSTAHKAMTGLREHFKPGEPNY